jgi:PAS domain S-box-containing protein
MLNSAGKEILSYIGVIAAVVLGLYLSSLYSYLVFHSLVEITTISIGFTLFILVWNTRRFLANDCLKFVGIGYAFIAIIDLLHTLAYKGMNMFPGYGANLPTQLWIAARFLQAVTLCAAPIFVRRRIDGHVLFGAYFVVASAIVALVYSGNFPDCYSEGKGLTPFKVISEYAISAMLIVALILFRKVRTHFNGVVYTLIIASIACTAVSEISFTAYLSVYGFANMFGHLLKLVAFYLIYRALLVTGLKEPFDLIFRDLKQTEEALRKAHDTLEEKVRERTAELRASEEKYRGLIEIANDAVFIHEITEEGIPGLFTEVNDVACKRLGYSREELTRMSPMELDDPRFRDRIARALERLLKEGHALFETAQMAKDGRSIPVEVSTRLVELKGTRLLFSLVRDITERKEAEEEIRRLKNYLANIIDSMPSILVGMDRDETVTQWNRHAEKISGVSATEAVGRPITGLLPDFFPWIKGLRDEIEQQRPASMEKLLIEKDGVRRFYDLALYPLIADGVEGSVVRIEDVTERARVQEMMIQTEKMMSVGGLAAGMAHEINNPLGIIIQAAQNIERRVSPELPANRKAAEELGVNLEVIKVYFEKRQIPEFIGSIRTAGFRAAKIVANMLQFSRCAGVTMQPVSPGGIIEQALELAASDYDLKKKFDFRSIEIIRDYATDMPDVPMVVVEMEQVMLNLLKNAAQAMTSNPPDRRPRITLRLRREERYALIEVEDNGPGMGEEVRRRVFEPFFTTKEPGTGTGLGLSVSYMIITQNHKGLMEVESRPGRGACFRVRLPLSKEGIHG